MGKQGYYLVIKVQTTWQVIMKSLLPWQRVNYPASDRVLLQIISQFCGWFQSAQRVFRSFLGWGSPLAQLSISIQQVNLTIPNDDDFDRFLSQENEIHSFKMIECRLSLYGKTSKWSTKFNRTLWFEEKPTSNSTFVLARNVIKIHSCCVNYTQWKSCTKTNQPGAALLLQRWF